MWTHINENCCYYMLLILLLLLLEIASIIAINAINAIHSINAINAINANHPVARNNWRCMRIRMTTFNVREHYRTKKEHVPAIFRWRDSLLKCKKLIVCSLDHYTGFPHSWGENDDNCMHAPCCTPLCNDCISNRQRT